MSANPDVLNSWKEVAVYLGRGVRTVQRWERDLNMPVRRPRAKVRSAVIAIKQELDSWLLKAPTETLDRKEVVALRSEHPSHKTLVLMSRTQELVLQSTALCQRSQELCVQMSNSVNASIRVMSKNKSETSLPPSTEPLL